jgi:subtilase family serine protease
LETRALLSAAGWVAAPNLHVQPLAGPGYSVYTPQQIRHAYGFDAISFNGVTGDGTGQTIAIVDAYDAPYIASDLATFDATFGLPNPTLIKATPGGQPAADAGWAGEITLDVEWAHAVAPKATILLVEAASNSDVDLLAAIDYARNYAGVSVVSMSWGGSEFYNEASLDSYFTTPTGHQGVTFVASSGDSGAWYGPEWPAVSPNVLAVGGTSLTLRSGAYSSESAWSGSGGGYSSYETEPAYQKSVQSSGVRTNPDVSYNANPYTGVYVYFTSPDTGSASWYSFGGTSAGSPQWAGLIAVADQGRALQGKDSLAGAQAAIYGLPATDFHDVTRGSNGYSAHSGYDLATGRGSPYASRIARDLLNVVNPAQAAAAVGSAVGSATTKTATAFDPAAAFGLAAVARSDQFWIKWGEQSAFPTGKEVVNAGAVTTPLKRVERRLDDVARTLLAGEHKPAADAGDASLNMADALSGDAGPVSPPATAVVEDGESTAESD